MLNLGSMVKLRPNLFNDCAKLEKKNMAKFKPNLFNDCIHNWKSMANVRP